jgi:CheY-like chemotaxis protein
VAATDHSPGETLTGCGPAILIVEDNDGLRELLRDLLEGAGFKVRAAADAVEGLSVLQSGEAVCLILLDLMMPGVSGFQFRAEQRFDPKLRDIPVAVLTGASSPEQYHGNLRAIGYLPKPFDPDQIVELVRQHCG